MKKLYKLLMITVLMLVFSMVLTACGKKEEIKMESSNYSYDRSVLDLVQKTISQKLNDDKYEDLVAVITYKGQKGFVLDSPITIEGNDDELVDILLGEVTIEINNEYEFKSDQLKNNDEVVFTIKDKKVTVAYDTNK